MSWIDKRFTVTSEAKNEVVVARYSDCSFLRSTSVPLR